jgi:arylsulfatase A-like enzyme
MVTHESGDMRYDQIQLANGTFNESANPSGIPLYRGSYEGKASFGGGTTASSYARGVFNSPNGQQDGYYGAAFYFPVGTFTGSTDQNGRVDIMGWSNDNGDYGGISIDPDHSARLVRGTTSGVRDPIGEPFTLREGCWNWLTVHQKASATNGSAASDVYLNGRRLFSSTKPNSFGDLPTDFRFGLVSVDTAAGSTTRQTKAMDVYVDDAYIASKESAIIEPQGNACRPNVLFIVSDDQRYDSLDLRDPTSGASWMAKTLSWVRPANAPGNIVSTEFPNAFDTEPLCCPSRASIMTGQYPHNTNVRRNTDADQLDQASTLQYYLREAGYDTAIFGKYLNDWVWNNNALAGAPPRNPPYFDQWAIYDNGPHWDKSPRGCDGFHPLDHLTQNAGVECVNDNGAYRQIPRNQYETTFLADKATSFIADRAADPNTPWLLYLTPTIPHSPFEVDPFNRQLAGAPVPPPEINASNAPESESPNDPITDKPKEIQDKAAAAKNFPDTQPQGAYTVPCPSSPPGLSGWSQCLRDYIRTAQLKMLKSLDDMVDTVLSELESTHQADDTLVFFISDNGFMWNEHTLDAKAYAYLEDIRTPLFVRWPNHHLSAASDSYLAANIDLAPTALAAARVAIPESVDGRDLLAFDRPPRDHLMAEMLTWASLIKPMLQYTEYYQSGTYVPELWDSEHATLDSPEGSDVREYYQLRDQLGFEVDPLELTNLLHDNNRANDPSEVTKPGGLHDQLISDRTCKGRGTVPNAATGTNYPACP